MSQCAYELNSLSFAIVLCSKKKYRQTCFALQRTVFKKMFKMFEILILKIVSTLGEKKKLFLILLFILKLFLLLLFRSKICSESKFEILHVYEDRNLLLQRYIIYTIYAEKDDSLIVNHY